MEAPGHVPSVPSPKSGTACDAKKSDCMQLSMTHDLIDLYMFIIMSMTFPVIPYENNFFHNVALLIESNALQAYYLSTKVRNSLD